MTLIERVRASLATDYHVRKELGRGGMGAVFLATDRLLERNVAIKVLLPGQATSRTVQRFLREARALARVEHGRVVRVHRAGEAGGLYYYVMDHVPGVTLAQRLQRGPLDRRELEQLAEDLLDAMAAIHAADIVHRDIKPSNIFLVDGRAVLGDFGIARSSDASSGTRMTQAGELVGTPLYVAPEQRRGEATAATDIYAAGAVLYEAYTSHPWQDAAATSAPWASVPAWLRGPLRRALRADPARRFADAGAFRRALKRTRRNRRTLVAAAAAAVVAALVASVYLRLDTASPPPIRAHLEILAFEGVGSPAMSELGQQLADLVTANLQGLPPLRMVPVHRRRAPGSTDGPAAPDGAGNRQVEFVAGGRIRPRRDSLEVVVVVETDRGLRLPEQVLTGASSDMQGLANGVALELLKLVTPKLGPRYRSMVAETDSFQALREFILAEHFFHENAWSVAEEHYRSALSVDPEFAVAKWRLWNVYRWRLSGREVVDLSRLFSEHAQELGEVDRALVEAEVQPLGRPRLEALEDVARRRFPREALARWLLGDELLNRGPLLGRSLEEAAAEFWEAAALNPSFGPAYERALQVLIRLGREEEARRANELLKEQAAPPAPGDVIHIPAALEQGLLERFDAPAAVARRNSMFDFGDPESWPGIQFVARMGLALDIPHAQLALGRGLVAAPGAPNSMRANGHMAQALALMVMGRPAQAMPYFDSAAALIGTRPAAVEAEEWRVVLPALGVDGVPAEQRQRGRERLRSVAEGRESASASESMLPVRAAWALSMDAFAVGDTAGGRAWRDRIGDGEPDDEVQRLDRLAAAYQALVLERPGDAVALTEPLLQDQFLPREGDPFTRTALHIIRAQAFERLGRPRDALAERMWGDNQDMAWFPGARVQPVEVDWVASPYSDRHRARLALAAAETGLACRLLERVQRLWAEAEPPLDPARDSMAALHEGRCP